MCCLYTCNNNKSHILVRNKTLIEFIDFVFYQRPTYISLPYYSFPYSKTSNRLIGFYHLSANESAVIKIENRIILRYLAISFLTKETFSTYSFMSGAYLLILCIQVPYYKFQNTIRYQIKYNLKVI